MRARAVICWKLSFVHQFVFNHTNLKKSTVRRKKKNYIGNFDSLGVADLCTVTRLLALITGTNGVVNSSIQREIPTDHNPEFKLPKSSHHFGPQSHRTWTTPPANSSDRNHHRRRNISNKPRPGVRLHWNTWIIWRFLSDLFIYHLKLQVAALTEASGGVCFHSRQERDEKQSKAGDGEGWKEGERWRGHERSRWHPVASALRFRSVAPVLGANCSLIAGPPRNWLGRGRRRPCTRLATTPHRSSRYWWWCHQGQRRSRHPRLKRESDRSG